MSVYTCIACNVVADIEAKFYGGTFITRLEERQDYDLQVRYYVWGPCIIRGIKFKVMENGDLFTANSSDAIYFAEFLMWNFSEEYYKENVSHDNDCYWDMSLQQWVGIALDSGAMYTPVEWEGSDSDPTYPSSDSHPDYEDMDSLMQSYCDEQQGDIIVELYVVDTLDSYERFDGKFDVVELMSDGNVRMVTKDYDPFGQYSDVDLTIGGDIFGHHVDQLVYVTDDSAGRLHLVVINSGETDEGNGSFTWSHYVKGVCDYLDSSVQFYLVYEDDLGRTSEMLLANDDPRIVKCSYIISLNADIPF